MTEITDKTDRLPPTIETFVLHWGDLGAHWGVNRSVSQIHALLYLADRPLTAEDIAQQLQIARSNVSNSLKELLGWDLIRRVPVRGDRRDHFVAETDVWEIAIRIARGRRQREIDPALAALRTAVKDAETGKEVSPIATERLKALLEFTDAAVTWSDQILKVPRAKLSLAMRLGAKVMAYLPGGKSKPAN